MAKKKWDEEDGVWRTIGGRRIFIRKGQNMSDAMKESGKFKSKKDIEHQKNKIKNDIEANRFSDNKEREEMWENHDALDKLSKEGETSELKSKLDQLRKDRAGLVYNLEKGTLKDLSDEEKLKKVNDELNTMAKDKERIAKIDKDALDYQKEKYGEDSKEYKDAQSYTKQGDDTFKKATGESSGKYPDWIEDMVQDHPQYVYKDRLIDLAIKKQNETGKRIYSINDEWYVGEMNDALSHKKIEANNVKDLAKKIYDIDKSENADVVEAYKKYKREHPNSKVTYNGFKKNMYK